MKRSPVFAPLLAALLLLTANVAAPAQKRKIDVRQEFARAGEQLTSLLKTHPDLTRFPYSTRPDGTLKDTRSEW